MSRTWTPEHAERHVLSLELFGMRFGLDRMRRLTTALGTPQREWASIHVVGTNGKSSTTRMAAALLTAHGKRSGAYLSPHLVRFWERILIDGQELAPSAFAAGVQRAAQAAELVERTLEAGERVTQFELLTAVAFSQFAADGVEVAAIEAGLGGRYDATNVIPSSVTVLCNVGLEHTRWLGPTVADIAVEKLDVLQPGSTLVLGEDGGEVGAIARRIAGERGARVVLPRPADEFPPLAVAGGYQRANFALACAAVEACLGTLDPGAVARAAAAVRVPGRFEVVSQDPLTIVDGAHNAAGMAALVASLPDALEGRELVAVVAILDDKDSGAMLRELLPACSDVILTSTSNPRALSPATLQSLAVQLGHDPARLAVEADPRAALARAQDQARARGGAVLATGSIYLVADLRARPGERAASTL